MVAKNQIQKNIGFVTTGSQSKRDLAK